MKIRLCTVIGYDLCMVAVDAGGLWGEVRATLFQQSHEQLRRHLLQPLQHGCHTRHRRGCLLQQEVHELPTPNT